MFGRKQVLSKKEVMDMCAAFSDQLSNNRQVSVLLST